LDSKQLADKITECIFSKKGFDVKILDLHNLTTIADLFIICSADSETQVKAISDSVDKELRDQGIKSWHKEGYKALSWVLIDYVDVVVHIFKKETRQFYNLEKLWGDAPVIDVEDPILSQPVKRKPGRPRKSESK
jgi:ribosome-associated protein